LRVIEPVYSLALLNQKGGKLDRHIAQPRHRKNQLRELVAHPFNSMH